MHELQVQKLVQSLVSTFLDGNDPLLTDETAQEWVKLDTPLEQKYQHINLVQLIQVNCQTPNWPEVVEHGLQAIEKYGRRLLTTAFDQLPLAWQFIDFSKSSVRAKIGKLRGGHLLLMNVGYAEKTATGVKFPNFPADLENNKMNVATVTSMVILARAEIAAYGKETHPHAQRIWACCMERQRNSSSLDEEFPETKALSKMSRGKQTTVHQPEGPSEMAFDPPLLSLTNRQGQNMSLARETPAQNGHIQSLSNQFSFISMDEIRDQQAQQMPCQENEYNIVESLKEKINDFQKHMKLVDDKILQIMLENDNFADNIGYIALEKKKEKYNEEMKVVKQKLRQLIEKEDMEKSKGETKPNKSQDDTKKTMSVKSDQSIRGDSAKKFEPYQVIDMWQCNICNFTNEWDSSSCDCCGRMKQGLLAFQEPPAKNDLVEVTQNTSTPVEVRNSPILLPSPGQDLIRYHGSKGEDGSLCGEYDNQDRPSEKADADDLSWLCYHCGMENNSVLGKCAHCGVTSMDESLLKDAEENQVETNTAKEVNNNSADTEMEKLTPEQTVRPKEKNRQREPDSDEAKNLIDLVLSHGDFDIELAKYLLFFYNNDVESTVKELSSMYMKPIVDGFWEDLGLLKTGKLLTKEQIQETAIPNSLENEEFVKSIINKDMPRERRIRMALLEGDLENWTCAEIAVSFIDDPSMISNGVTVQQILEAIRNEKGDLNAVKTRLKKECDVCGDLLACNQLLKLTHCDCSICEDCFKEGYKVHIRDNRPSKMTCLACDRPNLDDPSLRESHFEILGLLIHQFLDQKYYDLYQKKLAEWNLNSTTDFGWCPNESCNNCFADMPQRRFQCPECREEMCGVCKKPWEEEHTGRTCEEFRRYKSDKLRLDEETEEINLRLDMTGIVCPNCSHKYEVAKGGCMHFTCAQCAHQFCSGCFNTFHSGQKCRKTNCTGKGLHCHHPRDCLYHLRDNSVQLLEQLIEMNEVTFNVEEGAAGGSCPVLEMKEKNTGYIDEPCGRSIDNSKAGLCVTHYKEYLVQVINRNQLDPLVIMPNNELSALLMREGVAFPQKAAGQDDAGYGEMLRQLAAQHVPIRPSAMHGV